MVAAPKFAQIDPFFGVKEGEVCFKAELSLE